MLVGYRSALSPLASRLNRFQEDGAIVLRSVVGDDWIDRLRGVIETILTEKAPTSFDHEKSTGRFFEDQFMWMRNTTAKNFVFNGPMAQIASFLTNSKQVDLPCRQYIYKKDK